MRRTCWLLLGVLAVSLAGTGCNRSKEEASTPPPAEAPAPLAPSPAQPVTVVAVTLGKAVGMDKKVTTAGDTFAPTDTIYASVDTQGAAPSASIAARWTYQDGQVVHEETQSIAPTGPATTEFHITKPDGWPKGEYQVEIFVNDTSAGTRRFNVT